MNDKCSAHAARWVLAGRKVELSPTRQRTVYGTERRRLMTFVDERCRGWESGRAGGARDSRDSEVDGLRWCNQTLQAEVVDCCHERPKTEERMERGSVEGSHAGRR